MRKTVSILGIPVDSLTMKEATDKLIGFLKEDKLHKIYTPNSEIIMEANRDAGLKSILEQADMVVADGAGVVLASKLLAVPLPAKVSGIDLVKNSFQVVSQQKIRYFLFGSKPGIAEAARESLLREYPLIDIAGCRNGYFKSEDQAEIIQEINASGADILLVALGAPKQEKWIHEHEKDIKVKICIGVGGSLDVFAGQAKLAPEFIRKAGLEWLYRLYQEPWRYKRMLDLPRFILRVLAVRLGLRKS